MIHPFDPNRQTQPLADSPAHTTVNVRGLRVAPKGRAIPFSAFTEQGRPLRLITVGAHPNSNLCLADDTVSSAHCILERVADEVLVHDCDSTNGTLLNGAPVKTGKLAPGMQLRIGRYTLVVYGEDTDEPISLVARTLDSFVHNSAETYPSRLRAAHAIGMPRSTFYDWLAGKFKRDPKRKPHRRRRRTTER